MDVTEKSRAMLCYPVYYMGVMEGSMAMPGVRWGRWTSQRCPGQSWATWCATLGSWRGLGQCQAARWGTWTSGRGPANAGLPGVLNRGHGGVLGHARMPGGVHGHHGDIQGHAGLPSVLYGGHRGVQDHTGVHGE
jgi:hypothetical protein